MAEDKVVLTADASNYFDVMRRAGDEAEKFGGKINKTSQNLEGLRLKSESRVAHNIGEIAQSMTGGASAGNVLSESIIKVSESFRGSLLFAGAAAVGSALYEGLTRAGDATIAFKQSIDDLRRPIGNADFLGLDLINKRLSDVSAKLKEIHERDIRETETGIPGTLLRAGRLAVGTALGYGGPAAQLAADERERQDLRQKAAETIDQIAQKTLTLNHIEYDRVRVGEQQAELDKAEAEHKERLGAQAELEKGTGVIDQRALHAENLRFQNEKAIINDRFAVINSQIDQEGRLANIQDLRSRGRLSSEEAITDSLKLESAQANDLLNYYRQIGDADKIRTQDIVARRAQTALTDREFTELEQSKTDPFFSYRRQLERNQRQGAELQRQDYEDRVRRGGYGQTGPEADVFGRTPPPPGHGGIPDVGRTHGSFRYGPEYESLLDKFGTTEEEFESQFKPKGLEDLLREGAGEGEREDRFNRFFHPDKVGEIITKPGESGGGSNDVSVNVRHIREFLDRNLAVK